MASKKSLGTPICTLSQFQSFISSLGLLSSAKLHFGNNELLIHATEASNCAFVIMHYRTPIETPISIAIDLNNIKGIKADEIQIYTSNNQLIFNDDGLMYKCAALSDPNVDKRDREGPAVKWDHVNLALTNAHVKKVLTMINAKNKYNFDFSDNVLTINDATDNAMEYIIEVEGSGTFHTQVHGMYLVDIFMAPKYFTGCVVTLGNNTPFKVSYACEWLTLDYFVAPMIEQD
jgi:hypothetical protein